MSIGQEKEIFIPVLSLMMTLEKQRVKEDYVYLYNIAGSSLYLLLAWYFPFFLIFGHIFIFLSQIQIQ
jgi:hypothetical protein